MVFTREGVIYNKDKPVFYSEKNITATESVSVQASRVRRNSQGRQVSPAHTWICRIDDNYHFLPRGKKTASSTVADSLELSNSELFQVGDILTLLEPHTTLDTSALTDGTAVSLTIENVTDSFTIDTSLGTTNEAQVTNFINNSPRLKRFVTAIAGDSGASVVHIFAKGQKLYLISGTGVTVADAALVPARPIGTISQLRSTKADYNLVTLTPSGDGNAIAVDDVPSGAVIDAPVYQEVMGLFPSSFDWENISAYLMAPTISADGVNIWALSHYDESLAQMFPKIYFHEG